jgi:hypothetical protein
MKRHPKFIIRHSSFHRFAAFLAPAVGTDDADAIAVTAQNAIAPVMIGRWFIRCIWGSRLGKCRFFFLLRGLLYTLGGTHLRQRTFIFFATLFAVPVGTDDADAAAVTAQKAIVPVAISSGGFVITRFWSFGFHFYNSMW